MWKFIFYQTICTFISHNESFKFTGLTVDGEEVVFVPANNAIAELVGGGRNYWIIRVLCLDLNHGHVGHRVLEHRRPVQRLWRQRGVVIDILHLDEDLQGGELRNHTLVCGVDREPVRVFGLTIQQVSGVDYPWQRQTHQQQLQQSH